MQAPPHVNGIGEESQYFALYTPDGVTVVQQSLLALAAFPTVHTASIRRLPQHIEPDGGLGLVTSIAQGLRNRVQRLAGGDTLISNDKCAVQSENGTLRVVDRKRGGADVSIVFENNNPISVRLERNRNGDTAAATISMRTTIAESALKQLLNELTTCVHLVTQLANDRNQPDGVPSTPILTADVISGTLGQEIEK